MPPALNSHPLEGGQARAAPLPLRRQQPLGGREPTPLLMPPDDGAAAVLAKDVLQDGDAVAAALLVDEELGVVVPRGLAFLAVDELNQERLGLCRLADSGQRA